MKMQNILTSGGCTVNLKLCMPESQRIMSYFHVCREQCAQNQEMCIHLVKTNILHEFHY